MLCKYTYTAEDKLVQEGKKKVGEVCNSVLGSKDYDGYCTPHAKKMGTYPQDKWDEEKKRGGETNRSNRVKRMEKAAEEVNGKNGGDSIINQRVLEAMNLNDPFDLKTEYAIFVATNPNPGYVRYNEKMAYARWLRTPAHIRTPQTTEEAAEILGVSFMTLSNWKSHPDIIRFINEDMESRFMSLFPFAMYKLACRIDSGDTQSIKLYKEWYEDKKERLNKKESPLDIPDDLQKEANEYATETGKINRGQSLASEKNMVIDQHFAQKLPEDDE